MTPIRVLARRRWWGCYQTRLPKQRPSVSIGAKPAEYLARSSKNGIQQIAGSNPASSIPKLPQIKRSAYPRSRLSEDCGIGQHHWASDGSPNPRSVLEPSMMPSPSAGNGRWTSVTKRMGSRPHWRASAPPVVIRLGHYMSRWQIYGLRQGRTAHRSQPLWPTHVVVAGRKQRRLRVGS